MSCELNVERRRVESRSKLETAVVQGVRITCASLTSSLGSTSRMSPATGFMMRLYAIVAPTSPAPSMAMEEVGLASDIVGDGVSIVVGDEGLRRM